MITVRNLKKSYRINKRSQGLFGHIANLFIPKYESKLAVDGISFNIEEGEIVGFIGANGAGKSTTIKMITGILYPDSGEVEVDGFNPVKDRKKYVANIGVVLGQKSQLLWDLPVIDSYILLKNIYRIPDKEFEENMKQYVELLDMKDFINQPVRQLSLGQRMRADIAAALLHSPKIIFFDEPTIGLDVLAKERIREFIRYLKEEKKITMIFTTHDMSDIEKTCDRLIIIDKGKKVYDGKIEDMLNVYGTRRKLVVQFRDILKDDLVFDKEISSDAITISEDKSNKNVRILEFDNGVVKIENLIKSIVNSYPVNDIKIIDMDIESIVKDIYDGRIAL